MVEVKFYDQVADELLKFAVIIAKTEGKFITIIVKMGVGPMKRHKTNSSGDDNRGFGMFCTV